MSILVESLKRLYNARRISKEQLKDRVKSHVISEDEYKYITGELYA